MTTETVNTAILDLEEEYNPLMQEIATWADKTKEEVERSVGDADGVVRITRDEKGYITDVQYGADGGRRRSRLNKKTRRAKGRRRHSVRRKLRSFTARRR
jgi:hypothetical protein